MEKFKIADKTLIVKAVTIGQLKALKDFVIDLGINEKMEVAHLLDEALDNLNEFMSTVIFPDQGAADIDWDKVEYETLDEIITAFFSKNPKLFARLKQFGALFSSPTASPAATMSENTALTPSSGTKAAETI